MTLYRVRSRRNPVEFSSASTPKVAFTTFPDEIFAAPRRWAEQVYAGDLSYFNEAERGGLFAAWEEPDLFASECRAAFRPLR